MENLFLEMYFGCQSIGLLARHGSSANCHYLHVSLQLIRSEKILGMLLVRALVS